jgi:hypothetical protein
MDKWYNRFRLFKNPQPSYFVQSDLLSYLSIDHPLEDGPMNQKKILPAGREMICAGY